MRFDLQPAYIIHSRDYRDSSLWVEALTKDYGLIHLIAKGVRGKKPKANYLQPFIPVSLTGFGRQSLKSLFEVELRDEPVKLTGAALFSGFYINELISYLLETDLPTRTVYELYEATLQCLSSNQTLDVFLRKFEFGLLTTLGYGVDFFAELGSDEPINPEVSYQLSDASGFIVSNDLNQFPVFLGEDLLSIGRGDYSSDRVRMVAKSITRQVIDKHLNGKKIKSRELFIQ